MTPPKRNFLSNVFVVVNIIPVTGHFWVMLQKSVKLFKISNYLHLSRRLYYGS